MATRPGLASHEGYVEVGDSLRLYYRKMGVGNDTVVVLHGGPGFDLNSIAPDLEPLASGRTLVFYDQRGTGRSSVTADSTLLTADLFVSDLEAVRHHLMLGPGALVGHGWGAGLAVLYAMAHPDQVSRLLLIDPIPVRRLPYFTQLESKLAARRHMSARRADTFEAEPGATDSTLIAACRAYMAVAVQAYYADSGAMERSRSQWCRGPASALRNQAAVKRSVFASLGDWDWRPRLSPITVPVLVLYGIRDPSPVLAAREWVKALPDARLLIIPASGAFPFVEQPGQFFPSVNLFLHGGWPPLAEGGEAR